MKSATKSRLPRRKRSARTKSRVLQSALSCGRKRRQALLRSRGGCLSVHEAGQMLSRTTKDIRHQVRMGKMLGIIEGGQLVIPRWQFAGASVSPTIRRALKILYRQKRLDRMAILVFFLSPRDALAEEAPVDLALRADQLSQRCIDLASLYTE